MDPVAIDVERTLWPSAFSLVCAIVGSSAGLYCLFRLPLMIQLFHPGSFLLALLICMIFFAWPLVIAELGVGQRLRLSAVPALGHIVHGGRGIAFSSVLVCSLLTAAYSSSSLALVVSPGFDELVNRYTSSTAKEKAEAAEKEALANKATTTTAAPPSSSRFNFYSNSNHNDNVAYAQATGFSPSLPPDNNSTTTDSNFSSSAPPQTSSINNNNNTNITTTSVLISSGGDYAQVLFGEGGNWISILALFLLWIFASYFCYRFTRQAPLIARIMMPLPLLLWCVLALFASMVVENSELFRELLLPKGAAFWNGKLWANAAGQALLLLQVGTGVTITFGSKSKSAHNVVNVSIAMIAVALLFAFCVTVTSAGSIAIINNGNFTNTADFSSFSSLLTTTTAAPGGGGEEGSVPLPTTTTTMNNNQQPFITTTTPVIGGGGDSSSTSLLSNNNNRRYYSSVTILPALFVQAGAGSTAFGVIVYIVAVAVGCFSMALVLSSFYSCMADLHVALRSSLTIFAAATVCFVVGAPFAFDRDDFYFSLSSSSSNNNNNNRYYDVDHRSGKNAILLALDQAVVGCCLPLLVCAESLAIAFGGWGGVSALNMLKEMLEEDLTLRGKFEAGFAILRDFGDSTRYKNLLAGDGFGGGGGGSYQQQSDVPNSEKVGDGGGGAASTFQGRFAISALPFFLKLFVPLCAMLCTLTTIIEFAKDEDKTTGAETMFACVVVVTFLAVYFVASRTRPDDDATVKKLPWVEMVPESDGDEDDYDNNTSSAGKKKKAGGHRSRWRNTSASFDNIAEMIKSPPKNNNNHNNNNINNKYREADDDNDDLFGRHNQPAVVVAANNHSFMHNNNNVNDCDNIGDDGRMSPLSASNEVMIQNNKNNDKNNSAGLPERNTSQDWNDDE